MKKRKYSIRDIERLATKDISPKEIAKKYNVNVQAVYRLCEREHIHFYKPLIRIHTPYQDIFKKGKREVADELQISYTSVVNALNGKRVKILEELGIELSYYERDTKSTFLT